jgi:hypothetical protein
MPGDPPKEGSVTTLGIDGRPLRVKVIKVMPMAMLQLVEAQEV